MKLKFRFPESFCRFWKGIGDQEWFVIGLLFLWLIIYLIAEYKF